MKRVRFAGAWLAVARFSSARFLPRRSAAAATSFTASGFQATPHMELGTDAGTVAYGPDGTLYVVESTFPPPGQQSSHTIEVLHSDGTLGTPIQLQDTADFSGFGTVGGITWDAQTGTLLATDSDGGDYVYSIPVTGNVVGGNIISAPQTIFSDPSYSVVPFISSIAVRPNGDIFVSNAAGGGAAGIYEIARPAPGSVTTSATTVVSAGQDFTAGLGFDSHGNLIYQAGAFNFPSTASVYQVGLTGTGGATTTTGSPQLFNASSANVGSFDLAVTSGDHGIGNRQRAGIDRKWHCQHIRFVSASLLSRPPALQHHQCGRRDL